MYPMAGLYQPFVTHLRVEVGSSENTIRAYLGDIKRFRRWLDAEGRGGGTPPSWLELTEREIRTYLAHLATERVVERPDGSRVTIGPITPRTTHRIISSLRRWFDYCQARRVCARASRSLASSAAAACTGATSLMASSDTRML